MYKNNWSKFVTSKASLKNHVQPYQRRGKGNILLLQFDNPAVTWCKLESECRHVYLMGNWWVMCSSCIHFVQEDASAVRMWIELDRSCLGMNRASKIGLIFIERKRTCIVHSPSIPPLRSGPFSLSLNFHQPSGPSEFIPVSRRSEQLISFMA